MTAAVRKKDEELTINLKCIIGVLMTDSGLYCLQFPFRAFRTDATAPPVSGKSRHRVS